MSSAPRFSILIPAYNRADLIAATLDSVLTQSFSDHEIIVVDDGSTDRTVEVVEAYLPRVTLLRQKNQGAEVARHTAYAVARGEYIVLLDSDDLLLPGALATYDRVIRAFNGPPLVIGALCWFKTGEPLPAGDRDGEQIEVAKYKNFHARDRSLVSSCSQFVLKKSVVDQIDVLPAKRTAFPVEPCDIMLLLGHLGPCVAVRQPTNVGYRVHVNNSCGDLDEMVRVYPLLIELERAGRYSAEASSRFERYAYIGGVFTSLVLNRLRARRFGSALQLLIRAFPMIGAALLRKGSLGVRRYSVPSILIPKI